MFENKNQQFLAFVTLICVLAAIAYFSYDALHGDKETTGASVSALRKRRGPDFDKKEKCWSDEYVTIPGGGGRSKFTCPAFKDEILYAPIDKEFNSEAPAQKHLSMCFMKANQKRGPPPDLDDISNSIDAHFLELSNLKQFVKIVRPLFGRRRPGHKYTKRELRAIRDGLKYLRKKVDKVGAFYDHMNDFAKCFNSKCKTCFIKQSVRMSESYFFRHAMTTVQRYIFSPPSSIIRSKSTSGASSAWWFVPETSFIINNLDGLDLDLE